MGDHEEQYYSGPVTGDSWADPSAEQSMAMADFQRFNDPNLLIGAQKEFYEATIEGIKNSRVTKRQAALADQYYRLTQDSMTNFLLECIHYSLQQSKDQTMALLRRLHNNFFTLTKGQESREIIIRLLDCLLFELHLRRYPQDRETLIVALFEINKLLAFKLEQATQPKGLRKIIETFTKERTAALISRDQKSGVLVLQLEHTSDQLLLTGPALPPANQPIRTAVSKPLYPGHIANPEIMGRAIDNLVGSEFAIAEGINKYSLSGREAEALGELFTAVDSIINKDLPIYCVVTIKKALAVIKPFRLPLRLKDEKLNILANILITAMNADASLREIVARGVKGLKQANPVMFDDLERELFLQQNIAKASMAASQTKLPEKRIDQATKPALDKRPTEAAVIEEDSSNLDPLERLERIFLSQAIDFRQMASYDPYAQGVLGLILCGKKHPLPEELDSGYRKWQHLVHPDKNPTELAKEFSQAINEIVRLARHEEFVRDQATIVVQNLMGLVAKMMVENSIIIIPRQGARHIIVADVSIASLLQRKQYDLNSIRVFFHGQLVDPSQFDQVTLSVGDMIEIVTF